MSAAIICNSVSKSYRTEKTVTPALRGVDLEVNEGELFMLVGPSGCGKTTLISVMAGILTHDSGECLVFGNDLKEMSEAERTKYRGETVGFVFQSYNLIPSLTAAENVSIPLLLNGYSRKEALQRAEEVLVQVGLGTRYRSLPTELSGGQQQRVAIARALAHHPRLIVCDEPTSALDHQTGMEVMELFRATALKEQRTLVIVTHDARIFEFADRIAVMDDGLITEIRKSTNQPPLHHAT
jgi:putative ABC transport system ATP-binding protein